MTAPRRARVLGVGHAEHELALAEEGLPRRARRYLSRTARLARAAAMRALGAAGGAQAAGEWDALYVACGRGPTDPDTARAMDAAAREAGAEHGRLVLSAALEVYRSRRGAVQYLVAMEPAPAAWIARGAGRVLGPTHTFVAPGPAAGAQALGRALSALAAGRVRRPLVVGVSCDEDPLEPGAGAGTVADGAAAMLLSAAEEQGEWGQAVPVVELRELRHRTEDAGGHHRPADRGRVLIDAARACAEGAAAEHRYAGVFGQTFLVGVSGVGAEAER